MIFAALAALVATVTPAATQKPAPPSPPTIAQPQRVPDFATMLAMYDKLFPPQPDPDPARLALARITVREGLLPSNSFGRAMGATMNAVVERVLAMRQSDLNDVLPPSKRSQRAGTGDTRTLHEKLVDEDPYFDERMRLTRTAIEAELVKLTAILEPRLQEGLARAVARRLDARQLGDINTFFATDSGRALGQQYIALWVDPDLTRSMISAFPDLIALAPGAMQRIEAATASLPKPKKKANPGAPAKTH